MSGGRSGVRDNEKGMRGSNFWRGLRTLSSMRKGSVKHGEGCTWDLVGENCLFGPPPFPPMVKAE